MAGWCVTPLITRQGEDGQRTRQALTGPAETSGFRAAFLQASEAFQKARRPEQVALVLIVVGGLFGFLAAMGHLASLRWQSPPQERAVATVTRSEPDRPMDRGTFAPFAPAPIGPRVSLMRQMRLEPPFEPLDAIRFRSGDVRIQLADLEGPSADAVCLDAEHLRWGCGRQGRAALYNLIREATLTCRGSTAPTEPDDPPMRLARCEIAGDDLATEIVRAGFAQSGTLGVTAQRAAMMEAQSAKRGLWNGDWTILP